jgi:hypothetical protein
MNAENYGIKNEENLRFAGILSLSSELLLLYLYVSAEEG